MEWYFGHNCANYLPSIRKCRILIADYGKRSDLLALKWLRTQEFLVYADCSESELLDAIRQRVVRVRRQQDGKVLFGLQAAWRWDDCHSIETGGQCLYFEPHGGPKISCLRDLERFDFVHPNLDAVPSEQETRRFERLAMEAAPIVETKLKN